MANSDYSGASPAYPGSRSTLPEMAQRTAPTRSPHQVVAAVAERRFRSARARRRRRQVALWSVIALLVGAGSFGAGLLAAPLDYDFQPAAPKAVLLLDSSG